MMRALYYTDAVQEGVPTPAPRDTAPGARTKPEDAAVVAAGRDELLRRLPAALAASLPAVEAPGGAAPPVLLLCTVDAAAAVLTAAGFKVTAPNGLGDEAQPQTEARPQITGSYAAVVVVESIEVLSRLPETLPRMRRLLAADGRLLVAGLFAGDAAAATDAAAAAAAAAADGGARSPLPSSRDLTRHLYESSFAVLDTEVLAAATTPGATAYELYAARPDPYRVRPYQAGDEEAILDLFARAFHHRRGVGHWRWEYAANPYGNLCISLAVGPDGTLAAHYAGYPVRFWSDLGDAPRSLPSLHVGDTMTAPEARRVGRGVTSLLTRTVRHFYAVHCRGRVAFNFGANTGKIQRFSRRTAGALRLEDVPFKVRDLPGEPLAAPGPLAARLGGWRVERVTGFDERFDELFQRVRGAYRLLVERDQRYLAWRYAACPDVEYFVWTVTRRRRLVGWAVLRQEGERLIWGDALFDPRQPRAAALLLARATAAPEHRGARRIEGWLGERPAWWGRQVADLGFRAEPEPEDLGFVFVPFEVDPAEDFAAHLYYTKGDCDLF